MKRHHLAVAEFGCGCHRRPARGLLRKASADPLPSGRGTYGPLPLSLKPGDWSPSQTPMRYERTKGVLLP